MRNAITAMIRQLLPGFMAENNVRTPYEINCGLCEEFALDIINHLGGETDRLEMLDLYNLAGSDECPGSEVFDAKWLQDNGYTFPEGVTVEALNKTWWSHLFIHCDGVYFDAECPEGVDTPFALPLVLNNLKALNLAERA